MPDNILRDKCLQYLYMTLGNGKNKLGDLRNLEGLKGSP